MAHLIRTSMDKIMPKKGHTISISPTPFGIWLKEKREARGLNQAEVAELCSVSQEYISGLERGIRNPSRKMVWCLAQSLSPENATYEESGEILDEALSKAFGMRPNSKPYFSAETLRYAEVYENADRDIREILGQAQGLIVKALLTTIEAKSGQDQKQEQPA